MWRRTPRRTDSAVCAWRRVGLCGGPWPPPGRPGARRARPPKPAVRASPAPGPAMPPPPKRSPPNCRRRRRRPDSPAPLAAVVAAPGHAAVSRRRLVAAAVAARAQLPFVAAARSRPRRPRPRRAPHRASCRTPPSLVVPPGAFITPLAAGHSPSALVPTPALARHPSPPFARPAARSRRRRPSRPPPRAPPPSPRDARSGRPPPASSTSRRPSPDVAALPTTARGVRDRADLRIAWTAQGSDRRCRRPPCTAALTAARSREPRNAREHTIAAC